MQFLAALALALAGDAARAQALADDLAKRFPEDTIVHFNYLPTIRAQLALNRNDPSKAIEILQAAAPYELRVTVAYANSIPSTCAAKPIWPRIKAAKPQPSSRKSSTIAELS